MSRNIARAELSKGLRLNTSLTTCAACGQPMLVAYTKKRKEMTCNRLVRLHLQIRHCDQAQCRLFHHPYNPEAEGQWALPGQEFGLDVVLRVGQLRYRQHRSCSEIHAQTAARRHESGTTLGAEPAAAVGYLLSLADGAARNAH